MDARVPGQEIPGRDARAGQKAVEHAEKDPGVERRLAVEREGAPALADHVRGPEYLRAWRQWRDLRKWGHSLRGTRLPRRLRHLLDHAPLDVVRGQTVRAAPPGGLAGEGGEARDQVGAAVHPNRAGCDEDRSLRILALSPWQPFEVGLAIETEEGSEIVVRGAGEEVG